jgi:curved DNA-binding protein CbpA
VASDHDLSLLGLPSQCRDLSAIKAAFRRRAKDLHPDLSDQELRTRNHLLFVAISQAYRRILSELSGLGEGGQEAQHAGSVAQKDGKDMVRHKDPAYVFYRAAMRHLSEVHPSKWAGIGEAGSRRGAGEEEIEKAKRLIVAQLAKHLPSGRRPGVPHSKGLSR